jgi:hypothetical protein
MADIDTQEQFDAMTDAEKVQFLGAALVEASTALNAANELNQQLQAFNGELLQIIKGGAEDVSEA